MWKKNINFCQHSKNKFIKVKTSIPKIQCLKLNILFSTKGTKYMWKKTINFCHLSKNVSPQKFTCQKVSAFEIDYTFFNQRNKKEEDYQFLPPFRKQFIQNMTISFCHLVKYGFRQVIPCHKNSIFYFKGTNCMWKKTINL